MQNKVPGIIVSAACAAIVSAMAQPELQAMVEGEETSLPPLASHTVALVVQNHAAYGADIPMMALTDALTAKLSGRGFQVINPYNEVGVNLNRTASGENMPGVSAMEMARKLKADGAITASLLEFHDTTIGTPVAVHQYTVRIALNLADAQTGAAVCGETIKMKSPKYSNNQVNANRQEYLGDLLYAAAEECAVRLEKNSAVATWRPQPPPPPQPMLPPTPRRPVFDSIVDRLVGEMLSSPQFIKNYEEQKERSGRIPIAVMGGMENASERKDLDAGLHAAGDRFRKKLFDSRLFDVKDDAILVGLAMRIVASGNSATENGDLMEELKQHGSPDFFVIGNLIHFADLDGAGYYKFRITMHSLRTGKIVWEGIETVTTNKELAQ